MIRNPPPYRAYRPPPGRTSVDVGPGCGWWLWFAVCFLVAAGILGVIVWAVVTLVNLAVQNWGH